MSDGSVATGSAAGPTTSKWNAKGGWGEVARWSPGFSRSSRRPAKAGTPTGLLRRDVIQRVVRLLVQQRQSVGGAHAVGVQLVDVTLLQRVDGQPNALVVGTDDGLRDG